MKIEEYVQTKDLKELLDFAPSWVEYGEEIFSLNIFKGNHGYIAQYSITKENIHVDLQGIKFTRKINLFDTYRSDYDLSKVLISLLQLLLDNKDKLKFGPRTHPFNQNPIN